MISFARLLRRISDAQFAGLHLRIACRPFPEPIKKDTPTQRSNIHNSNPMQVHAKTNFNTATCKWAKHPSTNQTTHATLEGTTTQMSLNRCSIAKSSPLLPLAQCQRPRCRKSTSSSNTQQLYNNEHRVNPFPNGIAASQKQHETLQSLKNSAIRRHPKRRHDTTRPKRTSSAACSRAPMHSGTIHIANAARQSANTHAGNHA